MSGFLNNLAAKGRGVLPRLEPRHPAPYEGLSDGPIPDRFESIPRTSAPPTPPSEPGVTAPSSPTVPATAGGLADTTLTSNTQSTAPAATASSAASPKVVPSATPVAVPGVARRMADTGARVPPPLASASQSSTRTQVPHPLAKDAPASSDTPARAQPPATGVLHNVEKLRPVIDAPQTPPATKTQERALLTPSRQLEPAPLPLLQVEAKIPRPVTQAPAQTPGDSAPATVAPVVEVHIGTIEVVAAQPQPPNAPQGVAEQTRGISLDDFLDGTERQ